MINQLLTLSHLYHAPRSCSSDSVAGYAPSSCSVLLRPALGCAKLRSIRHIPSYFSVVPSIALLSMAHLDRVQLYSSVAILCAPPSCSSIKLFIALLDCTAPRA